MAEEYPDLQQFQDPEGLTRCFAPSATPKADQLHVIIDRQGRVWMMAGVRYGSVYIYGSPPVVLVARAVDFGFGVTPEPGWEEVYEAAGYSNRILREVKRYLSAHPPISWDAPAVSEEETPPVVT